MNDTTKIQLLRTSEISEHSNHKLDEGEPLVISHDGKYTDLIIGDGETSLGERKSINALTVTPYNGNKEVAIQVGEYEENKVTFSSGDDVNFQCTDNKVTIGVNNKLSVGNASIIVGDNTDNSIKISGTNGISVTTDADNGTIDIKNGEYQPQMVIGEHSKNGTLHTITVPEVLYGGIVICYVAFKENYNSGDTITVTYGSTVYVDSQIPKKTDGEQATVNSFVKDTCSQIILFNKDNGKYQICIPSATPVWY